MPERRTPVDKEDKRPVGRPLKYEPQEFADKIEEYFEWCDSKREVINDGKNIKVIEKPYTITGLCLYLDVSRELLSNYMDKEEYHDTLKKAKVRIENYCEEGSLTGQVNTIAAIFNLKNNFDWKDKQEVEHSGSVIIGGSELLED